MIYLPSQGASIRAFLKANDNVLIASAVIVGYRQTTQVIGQEFLAIEPMGSSICVAYILHLMHISLKHETSDSPFHFRCSTYGVTYTSKNAPMLDTQKPGQRIFRHADRAFKCKLIIC